MLEISVGTGRLALPLAARGLDVTGIEISPAMPAQRRAKPGAEALTLSHGDMATGRVPGRFSLVYLAFNTIMNLTSQTAQTACFVSSAAHLRPGGRFLSEVIVPPLARARRPPPGL
ncbi:MAG: class I SAM-dependent methyltransferase [Pseudomonadota bacterium]